MQLNSDIRVALIHDKLYIQLKGVVNYILAPTLYKYINTMWTEKRNFTELYLDLHEVIDLDSTIIGILAQLAFLCADNAMTKPVLILDNSNVFRRLELLNLTDFFQVIPSTQAEALPTNFYQNLVIEKLEEQSLADIILQTHKQLQQITVVPNPQFADVIHKIENERRN